MINKKIISLLHSFQLFSLERYYASKVDYEFTPIFFSKDEVMNNKQLLNTIMSTERYYYKISSEKRLYPYEF